MRIVQVNVVYGRGSTGNIVKTLHEEYLRRGLDSYVLYGRGPKDNDPRVRCVGFLLEAKLWRFLQLFNGNPLGGSPLSTWNLMRHIKKLKPDMVHVHCINGNMCNVPALFKWLNKKGIRTALTHHAKFMFTGGCGLNLCEGFAHGCGNCPYKQESFGKWCGDHSTKNYARMGKAHLDSPNVDHAYVSSWLMGQAEKSSLLKGAKNHVVFNPIPSAFKAGEEAPRKDYVFFPSSGAGAGVKGFQFLPKLAESLVKMGLKLVVAGKWNEPIPNVESVGYVAGYDALAKYYQDALCTVLLSQVESFSMTTAESLCCGTPLAGFKAGAPESIGIEGGSFFVEYGDVDALVNQIALLKDHDIDRHELSLKARVKFDIEAVVKDYLSIYESK